MKDEAIIKEGTSQSIVWTHLSQRQKTYPLHWRVGAGGI